MAAVRHLGFLKVKNFNFRSGYEAQCASSCQISRRYVELLCRYGRFSIFQYGGRRHLGFWKFQIFNGCDAQEGRTASACQILSKSLKPRQDMAIFQDGGGPPSWIFKSWKFQIPFPFGGPISVIVPNFCENRSNRSRDIVYFRFFKMAAVCHLGFSKVGRNFNFRSRSEAQYASSCQISRRSVEKFRRYCRFSIFQDGGRPLIPGSSGGLQSRCLRLPVKTISTDFSLLNTAIADMPRLNLVSALTIGLDRPELSNLSNKPKIVS